MAIMEQESITPVLYATLLALFVQDLQPMSVFLASLIQLYLLLFTTICSLALPTVLPLALMDSIRSIVPLPVKIAISTVLLAREPQLTVSPAPMSILLT